ncbi:MAG: class I SAM-dependent RNA methyltransferase [Candidatus Gracilibacteria bacterium]|nr:class I SAM-dependent RNA methyltransferase [Candidatus Gracilibacteria bacterium]
MNIVLTCPLGLESLAKKELELLGLPILNSQDKQITTAFSDENLAKVNLWSRIGNKVYIELVKKNNIDSFDKLFDLIKSIKWSNLILEENPIIINATSISSTLESVPGIQKIGKKAIVDSLTTGFLRENDKFPSIYVEIVLIKDTCQILIDSSGDPLHKRGYRKQSVEAPLRENLAAGLVLLSSWRFRENFYDFFCGSGTIVIEAGLIAKNIAPGLNRNFAFEKFKFIKPGILENEKNKAKEKIMNKTYNIFASDLDEDALKIASDNAKIAGVGDIIKFEKRDFRDFLTEKDLAGTIVSNPPYGLRLQDENIDKLYKDIALLLNKNRDLRGGVITDYQFGDLIKGEYKKRKLYNGGKMCYLYIKK